MSLRDEIEGRWRGRTVVCIASGPSLTPEDCETVHASGHPTIVTNTTFRLCPWADALMAFDSKWWREYSAETKGFAGRKFSVCPQADKSEVMSLRREGWFKPFGNSGTAAISLAVVGGAAKIVMLGYDCQKTGGKTHWHGDHPKSLGNAGSIGNWPKQFACLAKHCKGVEVVNASRQTALQCFPRARLQDAL